MDPEVLAKSGSEHGQQRAFFQALLQWDRNVYDHTFAIPNGGSRGGDARSRAIQGGKLKAEGVKPGVPDVMVAWPATFQLYVGDTTFVPIGAAGLFIELKKPSKGVISDVQSEWHTRLRANQYAVALAYDWIEAINVVKYYFGQLDRSHTIARRFVR